MLGYYNNDDATKAVLKDGCSIPETLAAWMKRALYTLPDARKHYSNQNRKEYFP